jgi:hypothetical protein
MGIVLDGSDGQPFELLAQKLPTARSEGEFVIVTVPAFAAGFPASTVDIQVRMNATHAGTLASQINIAATRALGGRR